MLPDTTEVFFNRRGGVFTEERTCVSMSPLRLFITHTEGRERIASYPLPAVPFSDTAISDSLFFSNNPMSKPFRDHNCYYYYTITITTTYIRRTIDERVKSSNWKYLWRNQFHFRHFLTRWYTEILHNKNSSHHVGYVRIDSSIYRIRRFNW